MKTSAQTGKDRIKRVRRERNCNLTCRRRKEKEGEEEQRDHKSKR